MEQKSTGAEASFLVCETKPAVHFDTTHRQHYYQHCRQRSYGISGVKAFPNLHRHRLPWPGFPTHSDPALRTLHDGEDEGGVRLAEILLDAGADVGCRGNYGPGVMDVPPLVRLPLLSQEGGQQDHAVGNRSMLPCHVRRIITRTNDPIDYTYKLPNRLQLVSCCRRHVWSPWFERVAVWTARRLVHPWRRCSPRRLCPSSRGVFACAGCWWRGRVDGGIQHSLTGFQLS